MRYIIKKLGTMKDPRQKWKIKYSLVDILAICIVAVMCGATTVEQIAEYGRHREEWFRGFLKLEYGIPNRLTFNRVLSLIDEKKFADVFIGIMQHIQQLSTGAVVSLDGKSYMTPHENGEAKHPLYMMNAWCNENNTILGQISIDKKTNEITAIPDLLKLLDVRGMVVTTDAIGCQKNIVTQIVDQGADYVIGLKENQPIMCHEMQEYAEFCIDNTSMQEAYTYHKTTETNSTGHWMFCFMRMIGRRAINVLPPIWPPSENSLSLF